MSHANLTDILAYVAGKLSEEDSFSLETHVARCFECAKRVRAHYIIRGRFDELWDSLSVKRIAEEY